MLPDNCLFEGKAGEVFEIVMQDCNVHTVLRLPCGTFSPYSQGVKANVIFLQKGLPTENVWIFDARSNVPGVTKKERPLTGEHFAEFEKCYGNDPNGRSKRKDSGEKGRFRKFHISEIKGRDSNSILHGSKTNRSKTLRICLTRRTWPLKPSPSLKLWLMT